jgi:signal transduction histidine kinase
VDLCDVIRDVVQIFEEQIREKKIRLKAEVPARSIVLAEKGVLTNQVVANVVSNAIKFSRINGEIVIFSENHGSAIHLLIEDHGVGIERDKVERILNSSELISTRGTSKEGGSGMGVILVREYMKTFNGEVSLRSVHESESRQCGTVVTLKFPVAVTAPKLHARA